VTYKLYKDEKYAYERVKNLFMNVGVYGDEYDEAIKAIKKEEYEVGGRQIGALFKNILIAEKQ